MNVRFHQPFGRFSRRGRWPFHRFRRRGLVEGAPDIGPEQRQGLVQKRAVGVLGWWMIYKVVPPFDKNGHRNSGFSQ